MPDWLSLLVFVVLPTVVAILVVWVERSRHEAERKHLTATVRGVLASREAAWREVRWLGTLFEAQLADARALRAEAARLREDVGALKETGEDLARDVEALQKEEERMLTERDKALDERDMARDQCERIEGELSELRERWDRIIASMGGGPNPGGRTGLGG